MKGVTEGMSKLLEKDISEDFPRETKQKRLAELARQEKQLLALKGKLEKIGEEKANINVTDPEAKVMRHTDGRSLPSYNHQSAVDGRCDGELDLLELVDTAKENTGEGHENVMADSAFGGYRLFEKVEQERSEQFFVPDTRFAGVEKGEGDKGKFDGSRFEKREDGTVICPAGHPMVLKAERQEESHTLRIYAGTACEGCPLRENCTTAKQLTLNVDSRAWGRSAQQGLAAAPGLLRRDHSAGADRRPHRRCVEIVTP